MDALLEPTPVRKTCAGLRTVGSQTVVGRLAPGDDVCAPPISLVTIRSLRPWNSAERSELVYSWVSGAIHREPLLAAFGIVRSR